MSALTRIREEILADKRKAAILGVLGVVAVGLGVRTLAPSGESSHPGRTAVASPASLGSFAPLASDSVIATDAERKVREAMAAWKASARRTAPTRDLFALDNAHFPDPSQPDRGSIDGAKSADSYDDDGDRGLATASDFARIRLKSTMTGNRTVAIFDLSAFGGSAAAMARVGDSVAGFRVAGISRQSVTLERDGVVRELRVTSPLDD